MSNFPKVTIIPDEEYGEVRLFFGEDEFPHEVWVAKAQYFGPNEIKVTLEIPATAVEFKKVD